MLIIRLLCSYYKGHRQDLRLIFTAAYLFAFDLLFVRNLLGHTYLNASWLQIVTWFCLAVIIVKWLLTPYSRFDRGVIAVLLLFGVVVWSITKSNFIVVSILLISASKNVPARKIIAHCTMLASAMIPIAMVLALTGVIPNRLVYGYYSFGFANPNLLAFYSILIALGMEYLCKSYLKPPFLHCLSAALLILSALITGSRACYLVILAFVLGSAASAAEKRFLKKQIPWEFLFLLFSSGWIFCVITYKSLPFLSGINRLCSGRLEQANYYLTHYGFSLFGRFIPELNGQNHWPWFTIDGAYGDLFVVYGFFACILFLFAYFYTIRKYRQHGKKMEVIILTTLAFHMLIENSGMMITYNPFLLWMLPAILNCHLERFAKSWITKLKKLKKERDKL